MLTAHPYTGPLAAAIRSTIAAFAKQRNLPCTVTMTYTPGAVPLVIDVDWLEIGRGFEVTETPDIHAMTDAQLEREVAEQVGRLLHPPKVRRFKTRRPR